MDDSPTRVLVVAHRASPSAALMLTVRERTLRGPAHFVLLVPGGSSGVVAVDGPDDVDDPGTRMLLRMALPALRGAARRADRDPHRRPRPRRGRQRRDQLPRHRRGHRELAVDPSGVPAAARGPRAAPGAPRAAGHERREHRRTRCTWLVAVATLLGDNQEGGTHALVRIPPGFSSSPTGRPPRLRCWRPCRARAASGNATFTLLVPAATHGSRPARRSRGRSHRRRRPRPRSTSRCRCSRRSPVARSRGSSAPPTRSSRSRTR